MAHIVLGGGARACVCGGGGGEGYSGDIVNIGFEGFGSKQHHLQRRFLVWEWCPFWYMALECVASASRSSQRMPNCRPWCS